MAQKPNKTFPCSCNCTFFGRHIYVFSKAVPSRQAAIVGWHSECYRCGIRRVLRLKPSAERSSSPGTLSLFRQLIMSLASCFWLRSSNGTVFALLIPPELLSIKRAWSSDVTAPRRWRYRTAPAAIRSASATSVCRARLRERGWNFFMSSDPCKTIPMNHTTCIDGINSFLHLKYKFLQNAFG